MSIFCVWAGAISVVDDFAFYVVLLISPKVKRKERENKRNPAIPFEGEYSVNGRNTESMSATYEL